MRVGGTSRWTLAWISRMVMRSLPVAVERGPMVSGRGSASTKGVSSRVCSMGGGRCLVRGDGRLGAAHADACRASGQSALAGAVERGRGRRLVAGRCGGTSGTDNGRAPELMMAGKKKHALRVGVRALKATAVNVTDSVNVALVAAGDQRRWLGSAGRRWGWGRRRRW